MVESYLFFLGERKEADFRRPLVTEFSVAYTANAKSDKFSESSYRS